MTGSRASAVFMRMGTRCWRSRRSTGAWPTLRAASDPGVRGGEYYGPRGLGEQRGKPKGWAAPRRARNEADAAWLWDGSASLTGVPYDELERTRSA